MKKSRFTESQIVKILKEYESGIDAQSWSRGHRIAQESQHEERSIHRPIAYNGLVLITVRGLAPCFIAAKKDNKRFPFITCLKSNSSSGNIIGIPG